ncbi:helix-turn-helix domain-containing protein [Paenarthrobacter sp. NPDC058040]|uniref:helix-turn-helix domain-containing protein n=1 Tax=unclassified Paenarthrobacter TaxID=2634190 RepID=UPI0036D76AB4
MNTPASAGPDSNALVGSLPVSPYMTRKQVAAYLNVSEKWLAQSGRATGPRFHKFGSQCRYLRDDVMNWARQQRATR